MKRIWIIVLTFLLALSICLSGCEDPDARKAREASEAHARAQQDAERARQEYEDLTRQIDEYNAAVERANQLKP